MKGKGFVFFYTRLLLLLLAGTIYIAPAAAQDHLSLPVDFMVENGNFMETIVTIKKDGATVFTMPGKENMKVKLQFNNDYVLSFSKPGYITKSIAVNTDVPPERMAQAFEPYKIGVKLFRQYEGVNIVVYSQPVARIYFNPSLDDFDYDVDYTKAILSILKKTEDELMQKAAEERAGKSGSSMVKESETGSGSANDDASSGQMHQNTAAIPPGSVQQHQQAIAEPQLTSKSKTENQNVAGDPPPALQHQDAEDPKGIITPSAAEEKQNNATANNRDAAAATMKGDADKDPGVNANPIAGEDHASGSLASNMGDDLRNSGSHMQGQDAATQTISTGESTSLNKFIEVEKNRTITTFRITKGLSIAEYRKVDYDWGGVFYFRDGNYAISKNLFHWATGE
jgi:hypothetical protein